MPSSAEPCPHLIVACLNEYELIRKYRCAACGSVMMCSCDREDGQEFLPHQLKTGSEYGTRARVSVDLGFQPGICRECRGLPAEAHPKAELYGATSKIKRYYWRELWKLKHALFKKWALGRGLSPKTATGPEAAAARLDAAKQALDEIKRLHAEKPKYIFTEESQSEVLRRHSIEIVDLHVTYTRKNEKERAQVCNGTERVSVEEYVRRHFGRDGWQSTPLESVAAQAG